MHPETAISISDEKWSHILLILRHQQVLARYYYILNKAQVFEQLSPYVKRHLLNSKVLADKQKRQIFFETEQLSKALYTLDINPIFLKGAAYTLINNFVSEGRKYSYIDILVSEEQLNYVEQSLIIDNWFGEEISAYDQHYYRKWAHEIPPLIHAERGTTLDVHQNWVPVVSNRSIDPTVLNGYIEETKGGYLVLKPEAMIAHSLIHLFFDEDFKHGYRDLLDLDILFKQHCTALFHQNLVELMDKLGFSFELFLSYRYCKQLLSTPIPEEAYQALAVRYKNKKLILLDYIFNRVLGPSHPKYDEKPINLALMMAFIRGHYLKMPIPTLMFHCSYKSTIYLIELIFGKNVFLK
ncbi:nucleotidyltransferase family protein [Catenovulum sp. SM1970]|uniref:nucleotidyltransferase family protein n=1 Tax=Marinifaba aquimaris TaxID=2741323 RepID=UPI0015720948|nr:nucleotidyltransferase family protein [Marinifaba aquimaris]NTS75963.1 nucleotidyltransferase family protein [Marinifaba aquimaris]